MPVTAFIVEAKEGGIAVVQAQECRCPNCNKMLAQVEMSVKIVNKKTEWDVKILCSKCKSPIFLKLK